jgi:hypothetical protein
MSENDERRYTLAETSERMALERGKIEALIAAHSEAELTKPGPEGWSVKDHLAHLAAWEQSIISMIRGEKQAAGLGVDEATYQAGFDAVNAVVHERYKNLSLDDVLAAYRGAREETLAIFAGWNDDDLYRPASEFDKGRKPDNDGPIINWIAGNTFGHDEEHLPWMETVLAS